MGIRYYAYAFDAEMTDKAIADPRSFLGRDPLADAWGLPEGFTVGETDFTQRPRLEDMLYLDKLWRELQWITAPSELGDEARPAYLMFEGQVSPRNGGMSWEPWIRVITPEEIPAIADDLEAIEESEYAHNFNGESTIGRKSELASVTSFLDKARQFVSGVEASGRGFVYMIG